MRKILVGLAVAFMMVLSVAMPAYAASGTTDVSGTMPVWTYTLTPPSAIALGDFTDVASYTSGPETITASTTNPSMHKCTIKVKDGTANAGYLANGADKLANPLQAKGGDVGSYTNISGSDLVLKTNGVLVSHSYSISDFYVSQTLVESDFDLATGAYTTTLTFTATFSH